MEMEIQRNSLCWGRWPLLLLLLGLAMPWPLAATWTLSYEEAVRLVVEDFNQRSREASLYRLLQQDPQPQGDLNPDTPNPMNFTLKETVCPRTTRQPPEQCDFKENGLVKECAGTLTLDQDTGYYDVVCEEIQDVRFNFDKLSNIIKRGGYKFGDGLQRFGRILRKS